MVPWEFATAGRILFGPGAAGRTAEIVTGLGARPLVVTGRTPDRAAWLLDALTRDGLACETIAVGGEPDLPMAQAGAASARRHRADVVVGLGGGSALDAAKAIAALATNEDDPLEYLEVVGRGRPLRTAPLPCVAVPTTSGTGSEVTRNAVLAIPGRRVKVSLRSPLMLPRAAIVDPELTAGVPRPVAAYTGLDALTQLIEPFLSTRATPLVDAICRDGIGRAAAALRVVCADRIDRDDRDTRAAREAMALASLFGGLALANAGLGAVHGLAGPIGGMFGAPHGAVCAALLPHVAAANLAAARARQPGGATLARLLELSRLVTGRAHAEADDGVSGLAALAADLEIPSLSAWGVDEASVPEIVAQAGQSSSMKGNPVALTDDELASVVRAAI